MGHSPMNNLKVGSLNVNGAKAFTPDFHGVEQVVPERFMILEAEFNVVFYEHLCFKRWGREGKLRNSQQQAEEAQDFRLSVFWW